MNFLCFFYSPRRYAEDFTNFLSHDLAKGLYKSLPIRAPKCEIPEFVAQLEGFLSYLANFSTAQPCSSKTANLSRFSANKMQLHVLQSIVTFTFCLI